MKRKDETKRSRKDKPGYVVNVPVVVGDNSDGESSCEDNDEHGFPDSYFSNPHNHFRLYDPKRTEKTTVYKRGSVSQKFFSLKPAKSPPEKTKKLLETLTDTAFGANNQESTKSAKERLKVVVGLNRMRSLSTRNNNALTNALVGPLNDPLETYHIRFFWEGVWEENVDGGKGNWKQVDYERVRSFYKILKGKNPDAAKRFLKNIEKTKSHLVPYREIRETIKISSKTKESVKKLREGNPERPVYLAISDDDVISWRNNGLGAFSYYDEMISNNRNSFKHELEIGTVGYIIPKINPKTGENNPMEALAVTLDLWVRHATASIMNNGAYYPEPSFIIRVLPGKESVEEPFIEPGNPHYGSSNESPIIINNIINTRNINPVTTMSFNANGAILMQMPERMRRIFQAHESNSGKIIRWTLETIKTMRGINQSHYNSNKWAKRVLNSFEIHSMTVKLDGRDINLNKMIVENLLISALSRLFNHFDPIALACKIAQNNLDLVGFQQSVIRVLGEYNPYSYRLESGRYDDKKIKSKVQPVWKYLSDISSVNDLKAFINILLGKQVADQIEQAAHESNLKVVGIFNQHLCLNFGELSKELLKEYFAKLMEDPEIENLEFELPPLHTRILESSMLNSDGGFTKELLLILKDYADKDHFGCTLMHYAALTGNLPLVQRLKKLTGKLTRHGDIAVLASGSVQVTELTAVQAVPEKAGQSASDELIKSHFANLFQPTITIGQIKAMNLERARAIARQLPMFRGCEFHCVEPLKKNSAANVLPIHLALQYCKDNGTNLALLRELTNPQTSQAKARDGKTPYYIALTELHDQEGVAAATSFAQDGRFDDIHQRLLAQHFFKKLHPIERNNLLCAVIWHIKDNKTRLIFVKLLIDQGADVNQKGLVFESIRSKVNNFDDDNIEAISDEFYQYPLFLAIESGDLSLVELLLLSGANTKRIYDIDLRPPIMCAMAHIIQEISMVHLLIKYGADVNDSEEYEDTTPLTEAIDPITSNSPSMVPISFACVDSLTNGEKARFSLSNLSRLEDLEKDLPDKLLDYLLQVPGINVDLEDGGFNKPLKIAKMKGDVEAIRKLKAAGARDSYSSASSSSSLSEEGDDEEESSSHDADSSSQSYGY